MKKSGKGQKTEKKGRPLAEDVAAIMKLLDARPMYERERILKACLMLSGKPDFGVDVHPLEPIYR